MAVNSSVILGYMEEKMSPLTFTRASFESSLHQSSLSDATVFVSVLSLALAALFSFTAPLIKYVRPWRAITPGQKQRKQKKTYPHGPRPWPLLGNLISFITLSRRPDQTLLRLARKYGGLCMLWFGPNPVIIVSSPKVAKDLMDKKGAIYSSRPTQNDFRAEAWPWRLVTTPTGETFRLLRKIYHTLLGPQQSAKFRVYQDFESLLLLGALVERPHGFLQDVERFAMSVIFSACYGVRLITLDHPVMEEFYSVWEVMLKYFQPGSLLIDFFPSLQRLPQRFQWWRKLAAQLRSRELRLHRAFLKLLKKQVSNGEASNTFGSHLVQIQDAEGINDDRACDILAMLIGAGADTTSSYLQSFFKVMALYPSVLEKAQKELDLVVGNGRLPTWEDETRLPYVRALIKEVHRWAPIGSLGVPHATSQESTLDQNHIPKGTIVFPNLTALSRSSEVYLDPDSFEPERFIADHQDASTSALDPDYKKRDHFHYGFGRRLCQGIFVAEASLYIVVSRVLWAFEIKAIPGEPLDMGAKISGLVTKPTPYRVEITPRSDAHKALIQKSIAEAKTDIPNFDDVVLGDAGEQ